VRRTIAFWTAKGGTGKTTAAVNVAAAIASRGHRTLLVDLDAQASATRSLGIEPRDGMLEALRTDAGVHELVVGTGTSHLDIVPAGPDLSRAERILGAEPGAETLLRAALRRVSYPWTVIDCPPGVGVLAIGALVASDTHVAVVEPNPLAVAGLQDALELADAVRSRLNEELSPSRVCFQRVPRTRAARLTMEGLREALGDRIYDTHIPERAIAVEAAAARQPVTTYAPDSPVAESFQLLAREVMR
jgi:chromosome partitioning protein